MLQTLGKGYCMLHVRYKDTFGHIVYVLSDCRTGHIVVFTINVEEILLYQPYITTATTHTIVRPATKYGETRITHFAKGYW